MTQLDVPNISFTHYLDLLKRRTWHVSILSVLGLVIGGAVAMLIPRSYVATTRVEIKRPVLNTDVGTVRDPMKDMINAAKYIVREGVDRAVRELGWTEAVSGSMNDRRSFIKATKKNVDVEDHGPDHTPGRRIAHIAITYKDFDGKRSAAMANMLRDIWLKDLRDRLLTDAQREIQEVMQKRNTVRADKLRAETEIRLFEEEHGINPPDWNGVRGAVGMQSALTVELRTKSREVADTKLLIKSLEGQIKQREADLDGVPRTLPQSFEDTISDPVMKAQFLRLNVIVTAAKLKLENIKPAHKDYKGTRLALAQAQAQLDEIRKAAGDAVTEKENPDYAKLHRELRKLRADKTHEQDRLQLLQAQHTKLEERNSEQPKINQDYRKLRDKVETLRTEERELMTDLRAKNKAMRMIQTERPYRILAPAYIPPTPTEPNPYMLALIGCIVGLALAIAVVFLIDFAQMSFKSVADVESGLSLPVLGTMSYLETEAEAVSVRGRRTRVTLFGVTFLVLLLTVVTIYYVSPTYLPAPVVDFFEMILGPK